MTRSCSEVAQRHTRYICLKDPFPWKAAHSQHVFASSAAFSNCFPFISCFTLISNRSNPSCTRNSSTKNQWQYGNSFYMCNSSAHITLGTVNKFWTVSHVSSKMYLTIIWIATEDRFSLLNIISVD